LTGILGWQWSDQVEFSHDAVAMFEAIRNMIPPQLRDKVDPPDFRDMRRWGSLQAAEMVAYETYKEYERVYRKLSRKERYGYGRMRDICESQGVHPIPIRYHSAESLSEIIRQADYTTRIEEYWRKKRVTGNVGKKRV